ncbi:hypothetical protein [Spirosoma pollinicola]|uniref:Uncharacterized protein n=1 Tax=Spirosoma pollinicola TaxID=2057025 RepID=A0A2K8Z9I6_9BACT|nr:hypothetical protein [Spirosoma pollinicola]AUD06514.1 hypothetical protein CWM47_34505 [Spirosoma pollinicola]RYF67014.1 MAG: hypothetical protein EOO39_22010 [Cytophagaceae bacterium]
MPVLERRPTDLLNALRLVVFCVGIELLGYAFSGSYSVGSVVGVLLGAVLVYGLLRLVHQGVNWARFILAGVIGLGLLSSLLSFATAYRLHPGSTVIDLISTLFSLIALWLLFTPKSNTWFRAHRVLGSKYP